MLLLLRLVDNNTQMSSQGRRSRKTESLVKELEKLCSSDDLSLVTLLGKINPIPTDALHGSSFLHRVCSNKRVSVELVEYILDLYPDVAQTSSDFLCPPDVTTWWASTTYPPCYPLHLACINGDCPNAVIELLVKEQFST